MLRHGSSTMSTRRAGGMISAIFLAATLLAATPPCATAAETLIRFSLDFGFDGPAAPFLLPLDKGYYKAEGLNVSVSAASGPLEAIERVSAGPYEMGLADINSLIKYRDTHPKTPIKAVFIYFNRPPYAVIGRKSRGIAVPKDLEGKKLGAPATDLAYAQWPIFAKVTGIDVSKVTIENIGAPVREPMLAAGQVDAVTGQSYSNFINLKDKGVPVDDITVLLMADYGVELYGNAIIVNQSFAAEHPEAVKGFLRAFVKGLKETVKQPASAVETVLKRNDSAKKELEIERLKMAIGDDIVTPEVMANGYGGIDPARFTHAIEQIAIAYKFDAGKPKPGDIFDDSFLPRAADRKVR